LTDHLLTVVIPTFNRPKCLNLTVDYLLRFSDFKIIVLDASSLPNTHLQIILNSKLVYRHTPNLPIITRLESAVELITTPYVQIQPDDDFMLVDSTRDCLQQLISDSSISTCIGLCYSFKTIFRSVRFLPEYTSSTYSSNTSDSISNRLYKSTVHYGPSTVYAIQRSSIYELWIKFLISIQDFEIIKPINPYLSEHFHSIFAHILGSSVVLPITHWFRSQNNIPITAQGCSRKIPFHSWLMNDRSRISLLSNNVITIIDACFGYPKSHQFFGLESTLNSYLDQFVSNCFATSRSTLASKFRTFFRLDKSLLLSESLQDRLRNYLRFIFFVSSLLFSTLTLSKLLAKTATSDIEYDYLKKSFVSQ